MGCNIAGQPTEAGGLGPAIENDLIKAVTPTIERAINNLAASYMPFPSTCGG